MIFIVSNRGKEEGSRISQHIYRMGYHFRETLVDEARAYLGETVISKLMTKPGIIEPIPETQAEIDKQADGAIRDLFPRIPNTDRQMIIEHSFQKVCAPRVFIFLSQLMIYVRAKTFTVSPLLD